MIHKIAQGYTLERLLMFCGLKRREKKLLQQAQSLYGYIIAAARQKRFYQDWAIRDDQDGRFEMLSLHVFLILDRIRQEPCEDTEDDPALIGQFLSEIAVADLENNLREMGVGDLGVGKRVQKYTKRQYARYLLYRGLFSPDTENTPEPILHLIEYVYSDEQGFAPLQAKQGAEKLELYIRATMQQLAQQPIAEICSAPQFLDANEVS